MAQVMATCKDAGFSELCWYCIQSNEKALRSKASSGVANCMWQVTPVTGLYTVQARPCHSTVTLASCRRLLLSGSIRMMRQVHQAERV